TTTTTAAAAVAAANADAVDDCDCDDDDDDGASTITAAVESAPPTSRSTLQDVIRGVGEVDNLTAPPGGVGVETAAQHPPPPPYLLLDVRDKDEFDRCHVISAYNYPSAMLSRTNNSETKQMLAYKNQPGRLILLYDYDESISPRVASTITERGFDNLFLLSGGLKVAEKQFPSGLLLGELCHDPQHQYHSSGSPYQGNGAGQESHFCNKDLEELTIFLGRARLGRSVGARLSRYGVSSSRSRGSTTTATTISSSSRHRRRQHHSTAPSTTTTAAAATTSKAARPPPPPLLPPPPPPSSSMSAMSLSSSAASNRRASRH
ncbi:hypothetical protein Ahia01_001373600, partial [Argonauta hians]